MKTKILTSITGLLISLMTPILVVVPQTAAAVDTCTWVGGGGDNNFSTGANWSGCDNGGVPEDGDSLVFSVADAMPVNDLGPLVTAAITFDETATITGNTLGIEAVTANAIGRIYTDVTLAGTTVIDGNSLLFIGDDETTTMEFLSSSASFSNSGGEVHVDSVVVGDGNMTIGGGLYLNSDNSSYTGEITVNTNGDLYARHVNALGAASAGTTVGNGGSINFCDNSDANVTYAEPLTLTGQGVTYISTKPKLYIMKGTCLSGGGADTRPFPYAIFTGAITLGSDVIWGGEGRDARITGPLSGTGFKITIEEGVDFLLDNQANPDTTATGSGSQSSEVQTTTYTGDQSGTQPLLSTNNVGIVAAGATIGNVTVSGGTLKGVGTTGSITMDAGTVAPGLSPGCLTSGDLSYSGGSLQIEIAGATVCTEYDQQIVNGTVTLGNSTELDVVFLNEYEPAVNTAFMIINNDGSDAVSGTFAGLDDGATFTVDGYTLQINYDGGDGNDVMLLVTAIPAAPDTGFGKILHNPLLTVVAAAAVALVIAGQRFAHKRS